MNEARLRELLREAPLPGGEAAERRGLAMVEAAHAERRPSRRPALPRAVLALAIAGLLAILVLSPAGAAVRNWIGDAFGGGVPNAQPGLTRVPGGGRLAVSSPAGAWVVQPDGSRRLLGDYREATWSPHGLYLAAASGRTLTAVEPDGTPHWSLTAPALVQDPRWSPSGFRIAYRAGKGLRVVAGDGSGDTLLDPRVAPIAPAWSPLRPRLLAYVNPPRGLTIRNVDSGQIVGAAQALPGVRRLEWGADGTLLESSPRAIHLRRLTPRRLTDGVDVGAPRSLSAPPGRIAAAALAPSGRAVAAVVNRGSSRGPRAEVVLIDRRSGAVRQLFSAPGRLGEIAWSPHGGRLLVAWRAADQWLFIPVDGHERTRAFADVARQFAPGGRGASRFPSVAGWCCR